jgi:signal transduction histidine kinase/ActR/RegA family two-component response regulator
MRLEADQKIILEPFVLLAIDQEKRLVFENSLFKELSQSKEILQQAESAIASGKNGEIFEIHDVQNQKWYSCKTVLVNFDGGRPVAAVTFCDVTQSREREECVKDSEKLFKHAQHIVHVGTWEWDNVKDTVVWSEELFRIYNVDRHSYKPTFQGYLQKIHKDDREKVKKSIVEAVKNKAKFTLDERILRPDGSIRYLHTYGQPVFDDYGEVCSVVGVCQDVTDFKLSEKSLEEALSLLRATIESTADGILVVDNKGKIVTFNKKFVELWRIPQTVLDARDDSKALAFVVSQLKDPDQFLTKVQELYSDSYAESFDTLEFFDERVFERYSKPQIIKNEPVGRVWSFRDVTARVVAEREAMAASVAKTQFLANISHEIRTPLTAVLGFSDLLADGSLKPSERLDLVSRVQIQGANLLRIVDDILDLSKIEFGHFKIKESKVEIIELVRDLKQTFIFKLKEKQTQLVFSTIGSVPCQISSDPVRLKQILMNLIGNSIKFTASGTVEVKLKFLPATKDRPNQLSFIICDTGIGMDMVQAQKLFEPFVQIDSTLTRKFSGTGLGLALSKDLAKALGGTVRLLESTPGKGSIFEAVVTTGDTSQVIFISDLNSKTNDELLEENEQKDQLAGLKVLLVEDSVDNQFIITQYLKKAGAEKVECASNGKDGIEKARAGNFDIVFMDLQMPVMNGYDATRELRAGGFTTPIIALTAHAMHEEIQRSLEAGCNYHLAKPIDRHKIIATAFHYTHLNQN